MRHIKEIEKLDSFKGVFLGNYILKSFDKKNPFGSFYLDNLNNWNDLKDKNIYLNTLDEHFETPLQKIKEVLIENFLKKNFIILKFESDTSSVAFYINNLPNMINDEFSIAQILINSTDFIDSKGIPEYNKSYNLIYILNDPSKEINITNTPKSNTQSNTYKNFSLDTKVIIEKGNPLPVKKYASNPDSPPGVANYLKPPNKKKYNDALIEEEGTNYVTIKKHRRYDRLIIFGLLILFIIYLIYMYFTQNSVVAKPIENNELYNFKEIIILTTTEYSPISRHIGHSRAFPIDL